MDQITYVESAEGVDWDYLKAELAADQFDNGRTAEQLQESSMNSAATCFAYEGTRIVGTARALSDRVCNAYLLDIWTLSRLRRKGIARSMVQRILAGMEGQHVYLFTDDAQGFYEKLGFQPQGTGLGLVVGQWLKPTENDLQ